MAARERNLVWAGGGLRGSSGGMAMAARTGEMAQVIARASVSESWGGARECFGLARRASSGAGGREDVGGAQQHKIANGGSSSQDSLERLQT